MLGTRQEKHIVVFPDDTDSSTCKLLNLRNNREKCKGSALFSLEPIQGKEIEITSTNYFLLFQLILFYFKHLTITLSYLAFPVII